MSEKPLVTLAQKLASLDLDAEELAVLDHILSRAEAAEPGEVEGFRFENMVVPELHDLAQPSRLLRAGGADQRVGCHFKLCGLD